MLRAIRKEAYKLITIQISLTTIISIIWLMSKGMAASYSALLGGICCILPSLYFFHKFLSEKERSAGQIIRDFYVGELIKLFLSMTMLLLILHFLPVKLIALVSGYIVAYVAGVFLP